MMIAFASQGRTSKLICRSFASLLRDRFARRFRWCQNDEGQRTKALSKHVTREQPAVGASWLTRWTKTSSRSSQEPNPEVGLGARCLKEEEFLRTTDRTLAATTLTTIICTILYIP